MEDLKQIVAENITRLRTAANLTQAELGSMVNYSDKSISKWERGDAIPDVRVLLQLAQIFGVTVDDLLKPHDGQQPLRSSGQWHSRYSSTVITMVAIAGIWTLALLIFALLWMSGTIYWLVFVFAVPLTLVTWLILNSVWKAGRYNYFIVSGPDSQHHPGHLSGFFAPQLVAALSPGDPSRADRLSKLSYQTQAKNLKIPSKCGSTIRRAAFLHW